MAESDIQEQIMNYLKCVPQTKITKVLSATENGVADILVCHKGEFIAIEVKTDEKAKATPDPLQAIWLNSIIAAGGRAICTNNVVDVMKLLNDKAEGTIMFPVQNKVKYEGIL